MKYVIVIFSLFSFTGLLSQYPQALVNEGTVTVNNRFEFKAGEKFDVRPNMSIVIVEDAILTCERANKICIQKGHAKISYEWLMNELKKSKITKDAYFENMFSGNYKLNEDRVGGVSRDLDKDKPDEYFYPVDNMQVLSNKVRLEMGNTKTYFLTDCKVQCPSGEILQFTIGENLYIEFDTKDPGEYIWEYDILIDDEEYAFRNVFFVPEPKIRKKAVKQYQQFLKNIRFLSDESIDKFAFEWLYSHNYYFL